MTERKTKWEHPAIALIKEKGVGGLGGFDGCQCTHFLVHGVNVDVSCRKSSGFAPFDKDFIGTGLRVWARGGDAGPDDLEAIARVAAEDLVDWAYEVRVRYCSYESDKECQCVYCRAPREQSAYLCENHQTGTDPFGELLAPQYDMRSREFVLRRSDDE